ncbi:MAG TPA: cation:proton antiporter [Rhizomicrobium sp.]
MIQSSILALLVGITAGIILLAGRLKLPASIVLVIGGVGLAFLPGVPAIRLDPQFVLTLLLPPIIYATAIDVSWRDFRANLRPIVLLAFGGVLVTACATAAAAHILLGLRWPVGFVLGALVSPTDAEAPLTILRRLRLPRRLVVVIEGEGLANDATALVLYKFAVAAAGAAALSLQSAVLSFSAIVAGEIVWGVAVGWTVLRVRRWARDIQVELLFSILTPFLAFLPPEGLGGSGVLATAAAGLYVGWNGPRLIGASTRLQRTIFWRFFIDATASLLFLTTGLQVRTLMVGAEHHPAAQWLTAGVLVGAVVVLTRFAWVFPATYVPRWLFPGLARRDPLPPWQWTFTVAFIGIRGAISLAAALALPASFPERDLLLVVTFAVIVVTLIGQGLLLSPVVRALRLGDAGEKERRAERAGEIAIRLAALRRSTALIENEKLRPDVAANLRAHQADRAARIEEAAGHGVILHDVIELQMLDSERAAVDQAYRAGRLRDESRRRIEYEIDLRELQIRNHRSED